MDNKSNVAGHEKGSFKKQATIAIVLLCLLVVITGAELTTRGFRLWDLGITIVSGLSALVLFLNLRLARGEDVGATSGSLARIMQNCSYLPYIFGVYLFLIKGFWSLTLLIKSFSIMLAAMTAFYLLCGHFVVNAGFKSCPLMKKNNGDL